MEEWEWQKVIFKTFLEIRHFEKNKAYLESEVQLQQQQFQLQEQILGT